MLLRGASAGVGPSWIKNRSTTWQVRRRPEPQRPDDLPCIKEGAYFMFCNPGGLRILGWLRNRCKVRRCPVTDNHGSS